MDFYRNISFLRNDSHIKQIVFEILGEQMKLSALRAAFLDYFAKNGHTVVPSSSLIPHNDETLLFTNAGMVQFKDVFLGQDKRDYTKATSSQRCVRAGGKHNDLDNVGYTARHHTFFEMLGNFSFGAYFKKEAIHFAWNFITKELKIPPEKLWVSVFKEDAEAEDIWLNDVKIDPKRFSRCGEKDNFWAMGDTGPCGPCTEIFYDHGSHVPGGPPGSEDADGDRYIEIWNLVFMQFNRAKDGSMTPLPKPSVDTGMGLERMAAVMQGVHSNYEIDLFQALIKRAHALLPEHEIAHKSYLVLADHIRATCFLILDGVVPSNEGRGYVLRRIMRRALRHGGQLGAKQPFFYKMVVTLCELMGDAYPALIEQRTQIEKIVLREEEQFEKTLEQGLKILEAGMNECENGVIPGELAFKLYDTYGFPIDLTADVAREKNVAIDMQGFDALMIAQKERARASSQFSVDYNTQLSFEDKTTFTGYTTLEEKTQVLKLVHEGKVVTRLEEGKEGIVLLPISPFYAESGGQAGDHGEITFAGGSFEVRDTQKSQQAILHLGVVRQGVLSQEMPVVAKVNQATRQPTRRNHSATHLLHAALRRILGTHVTQKGSLVSADRLRFDFSHTEGVSAEQLKQIELLVNEKILENTPVIIEEMAFDDAIQKGVMALFGEKYGKTVRVLSMGGDFSIELCGGTHVARTGDIGLFVIVQELGIAAGVRRIEALTGLGALNYLKNKQNTLVALQESFKADDETILQKSNDLLTRLKTIEKENERLKHKLASQSGGDLLSDAQTIQGMKVLIKKLEGVDPKLMRQLVDDLKNKIKSGIVVLATVSDAKVQLIVGITKDCTQKISAGELIGHLAAQVGGSGGGRPDMAQAGGSKPECLEAALVSAPEWIEAKLKATH